MFPNYCDPAVVFTSAAVPAHIITFNEMTEGHFICVINTLYLKTSAWVPREGQDLPEQNVSAVCLKKHATNPSTTLD